MAGLAGAAGLSPASAFGSDFASVFGSAFAALGFSSGWPSALGAGAALAEKLSAMRLALASSTLEAWLLTSRPNSWALATTSLLVLPNSRAISFNLFLDNSLSSCSIP